MATNTIKRCSALCTHGSRVASFPAQPRRWMTYDKSKLTKEALLQQAESGLGYDADGNPLKIDPDAKTVATAVGDLPISPLMDPAWMQARRQGKKNKAQRPTGRLRRKLANNPYALALITPIRKCVNTGTAMPRFFLQDFELVKHPSPEETDPWWAPGPLAFEKIIPPPERIKTVENEFEEGEVAAGGKKVYEEKATEELGVNEAAEVSELNLPETGQLRQIDSEIKTNSKENSTETPKQETLETPQREPGYRAPITGYALGRKRIIDAIGNPTLQRRLLPGLLALRNGMAIQQVKGSVWRSDMGDVVLRMMRERVVDSLIARSDRGTRPDAFKFVEPCADWAEVQNVHNRGCVLWLPATEEEPHQYATLDVEHAKFDKKMAVHNLAWLLGKEEVKRLKDSVEMFRDNELLVLKKWRSDRMINLHLLLWRLQGYLDGVEVE